MSKKTKIIACKPNKSHGLALGHKTIKIKVPIRKICP